MYVVLVGRSFLFLHLWVGAYTFVILTVGDMH